MAALKLSKAAQEERRRYNREYQRRRRAKMREHQESYWERKAKARIEAENGTYNDQVRGAN